MTTYTMSDPINRALDNVRERIDSLDAEAHRRMSDAASLDMGDWLAMGDLATRALMAGVIDSDTAQSMHHLHTIFHMATLPERVVFVQLAFEVMGRLR